MPPGRRWQGGRDDTTRPRQIRNFLEPALLLLLYKSSGYGYELINGLESIGFSQYPIDPSMIYRTLTGLESIGKVASAWDDKKSFGPPRRVYRITKAGEEYLREWVTELHLTDEILHKFLYSCDEILK